MGNEVVLIELFSGIGGFAKGLQDAGFEIEHHLFSEIDQHAIANYKYNFPNAEYIGSVVDVSGTEIRARFPDKYIIVTYGFPCQDLSIAGKRLGFKGKRSSLFYHAARLIRECQADNYIWENVQGLMSANKGDDINAVFEEMFLSGYLFDVEELNTAWVLPQNRVRLYSVGYNIKFLHKCSIEIDGAKKNSNTCVKIIEGFLLTKFPEYLTEVLSQSEQKRKDLELSYLKTQNHHLYLGLNLKNKFLEIIQTLQLSELQNLYPTIQSLLLKGCDLNLNTIQYQNPNTQHTGIAFSDMENHQTEREKLYTSIEQLLNQLSEETYIQVNKSIILTLIDKTTMNQIYSYAEMQRNIELFIIQSTLLFPDLWNLALSNLIEKKKNINYASKNRNSKGKLAEKVHNNAIQFSHADGEGIETCGHSGNKCGCELFPITENDFRSTKGAVNSATVRTITGGGQFRRVAQQYDATSCVNDRGRIRETEISTCIDANYCKGTDQRGARTMIKVKSATKSGYEKAETGDSINLSLPNSTTRRGRVGQGQAQTLDTQSNQAVLLEGYNIRRLTETECEKLQGFPENWTQYGNYNGEIKQISKTQRYKMCGNAVTVDIVKLIGIKLLESISL